MLPILPTQGAAPSAGEPYGLARNADLARVDALQRTGLLDIPPDPAFDRVTALACRLLRVPVALMVLVDETRQVVKSACGLTEPWDACREMPLARVFCQRVVECNAPEQIEDTAHHPMTDQTLARHELGIVSYLGVPLQTPDGWVLGALCVMERQARAWRRDDVAGLEELAAVMARQIDVRRELKQCREAIQAGEQLNQSLLDSSGDCIQMMDVDGHLLYVNPTGCDLMEIEDPVPLVGRYWPSFWSGEALQAAEAAIAQARVGGSGRFQAFCSTLKGTPKWWDVLVTAVADDAGRAVKLLAVSRDVTIMKEAESQMRESEARFRTLANNMAQLAWTADASGWLFWYNQRWFDYTGTTLEEMQGWGWQKVHHPDHVSRVVEKISHSFQTGDVWEDTFPLRGRDGNYRWFLSRAFPIRDGEGRVTQWFGTNTDITEQLEAEAAVQASAAQLRLVTDNASVFLLQCDRAHRFKFVNRPYADRFGLEPQQIIGAHVAEIIGADAYALIQPHMAAVLAGQRVEFELELPYEQLGRRWMHVVYVPERAPHGDVIGFVGVITDVSLRKRAEDALRDSEERLKLALSGANMGVWTWDVNTGAVYWSPEVYQLFGTETFDGTAEAFTQFIHPEDVSSVWAAVEGALAHKSLYRVGFRIVQPDGTVRWMATRGRADYGPDGKPVRMLGIVLDVTDRRRAEQAVERARDEALAASRAKDDFLAALSHELRTPLNPVLLLASEAANNAHLPQGVRGDFDTIAKHVALEARLIDDLLDLTRITRGKLVLDPYAVDVHGVVKDAVATVQAELEQKQLRLSLALNAEAHTVMGDATRLQQVFWNVLKNAVKFTPEAGQISIETLTCAARGRLKIHIVDTGIGISPEELERVFNAFSQGDHVMRGDLHRFGGVGLGLAISRMLVELHDGQISASSAGRGHGATFVITLPLLRSALHEGVGEPLGVQTAVLSQNSETAQGPRHGRILLVEDHSQTRRTLARLLTRRRYDVSAAASVAEAHALASEKQFDLVISDIGLPDGDGCTLMAELRLAQPDLTGIALSGYGMEEDLLRSRAAGFAAHLIKPIKIGDLERVLADLLPASGPA